MESSSIYRFLNSGKKHSTGCAFDDVLVVNRVSVFVVAIRTRRGATLLKCLICVQPFVLPRALSSLILS